MLGEVRYKVNNIQESKYLDKILDDLDMYIFERKVRFYEKNHKRQVSKMIVISPMIDERAKPVAEKLGIDVYTSAENVEKL